MNYDFLDLLLDAESAAQAGDEQKFTGEIHKRWMTHGPELNLTARELKKLVKIAEVFRMTYDFLDLLLDAESAAQEGDETEFTDQIRERWLTYGRDAELTELELNKLMKIAGFLE